jgi:predicted dehydrogenase
MAMNHAECREMIDACAQAGVPLYVAYYRRALPRFVQIKQWIDEGAIGAVRSVNVTLHQASRIDDGEVLPWRVQPDIAGGGLFLDVGSHMLDFLDYALGPLRQLRGQASNQGGRYQVEDHVTASLEYESGVTGVGDWCFDAFDTLDRTEITGTAGKIVYATYDDSPVVLVNSVGVTEAAIPNPAHIQAPLIQSIVHALQGRGECPSTGKSAARTTWAMDQLLQEYRQTNEI